MLNLLKNSVNLGDKSSNIVTDKCIEPVMYFNLCFFLLNGI